MLDDLKMIHDRDSQDALGALGKQLEQLKVDYPLDLSGVDADKIENIVWAGMGGSALSPEFAKIWPGAKVPFEIVKDYDLPSYVDPKTLAIICSYSGNTEEALSTLEQAKQRGCTIIVISNRGKLQDIAAAEALSFVHLPDVPQPRYSVLAGWKIIIEIFSELGLLPEVDLIDWDKICANLQPELDSWAPDVPTAKNYAKQLALDFIGTSPAVYAGPKLAPAAYKWKISFNENAKNVAWAGQYPEFSHNEFIGWSSHPVEKPYSIIDLQSDFERPRIAERMDLSARMLSGKRPAPTVVKARGESLLEQLIWMMALGDFTTLYAGLLNGVDPSPVELVEKFKKNLS